MDIFEQSMKRSLHQKQRQSYVFAGVSRDKKPVWGNRFVKDHNNLVYDANPQSIAQRLKKSSQRKKIVPNKQVGTSATIKYKYSPFKQRGISDQMLESAQAFHQSRNQILGMSPLRYLKTVEKQQSKTREGISDLGGSVQKDLGGSVQKKDLGGSVQKKYLFVRGQVRPFDEGGVQTEQEVIKSDDYKVSHGQSQPSLPNLFGLSQFEFQKTIEGKITKRNKHHMGFQKYKARTLDNTNKLWYDFSKDYTKPDNLVLKQKQRELGKLHSFKSYSAHRLFSQNGRATQDDACGNGGLLDKFYETTNPRLYELTRQRVIKDAVNYKKMTARPPSNKKMGTNLQYDTQKINSLSVGNQKRATFELDQTQRKLVFMRQVISPKRGCFR